jgi:hypothetical protein
VLAKHGLALKSGHVPELDEPVNAGCNERIAVEADGDCRSHCVARLLDEKRTEQEHRSESDDASGAERGQTIRRGPG